MLPDRLTEQDVSPISNGNTNFIDNLHNAKFRGGDTVFKKLIAGSAALKDLIALVIASILMVAFFVFSGGLDVIEKWERKNNISNLRVEEIVIVLIILGIATAIFFIRRYQELQEEILEGPESKKGLRSGQKQTIPPDKDLEILFHQVEAAKTEWERSLDSIEDMVILSDLDGTIHRCNRSFKDFIGWPYEEILGKNLASLLLSFEIEVKDLDLKDLNARLNVKGKWFIVKSYPYKDFETGNITKAVIIMRVGSTNKGSARVQFVWGRAEKQIVTKWSQNEKGLRTGNP
jgi:PAS domain-containing protein